MQVNKRARNRLIGVTAIIVIIALAVVVSTGSDDGALNRTVEQVVDNPEIVGERISVSGAVVAGSWNRESSPMVFDIRDEGSADGPVVTVRYSGGVPSTFGDGVVAIIKGTIGDDGVLESADMITKCPSKYETAKGALTVDSITGGGANLVGTTVKMQGFVVKDSIQAIGGDQRFVVATEDGSAEIGIAWNGALPEGMDTGSQVVITGALEEDGLFAATDVAIAEETQ